MRVRKKKIESEFVCFGAVRTVLWNSGGQLLRIIVVGTQQEIVTPGKDPSRLNSHPEEHLSADWAARHSRWDCCLRKYGVYLETKNTN